MKFHLSIVLDKSGKNRQDLYSCKTLKELDEYLLNFKDSGEVREKYLDDISEFLLDNMNYVKESEKRNNRLNNGRICIVYEGNDDQLRMFSIIYQNGGKLMEMTRCFSKIRSELNNDEKIRELLNRKRYLLSQYEIDLISDYLMYPVSYKRYKRIFINGFIARLEKLNDDNLYMYLRSIMNICGLLYGKGYIKTKQGDIGNVDINMPSKTNLRRDLIVDDCHDELFMQLYQSGDYERLHELYDIEEIDKYIKNGNKIKEKRK